MTTNSVEREDQGPTRAGDCILGQLYLSVLCNGVGMAVLIASVSVKRGL